MFKLLSFLHLYRKGRSVIRRQDDVDGRASVTKGEERVLRGGWTVMRSCWWQLLQREWCDWIWELWQQHVLSAVLQLSAINRTPVACDRAVSKLLLRCCNGTDRQTDRPTDSVPLHSHCCAYYAGSANSVLQYADICWRPLFNRKLCTTKLTVGLRCLVGIGQIVNQKKATEMLRHTVAYRCTA